MEKERKPYFMPSVEGSCKRPKVLDMRSRSQQGKDHCGKCDRTHKGACMVGGSSCFSCGRTGHIGRDCTATTITTPVSYPISFHCNQRAHKKARCSSFTVAGSVSSTVPATLRITDSRLGKVDALVVKSRAF